MHNPDTQVKDTRSQATTLARHVALDRSGIDEGIDAGSLYRPRERDVNLRYGTYRFERCSR